jgi:NAD(P)-dependent dehydrogenase (short-subunit alcohol dehydrogenase family)
VGRFDGKVVVVAGAATGMGAETARRLASEGAHVVVGDLNVPGAEKTVADIVDAGGTAVAVSFDLGDEATIEALMQAAVDTYGGLDHLFANAADLREEVLNGDTDALTIELDLWHHMLRVDLGGYLLCCRYAIPHMLERGGGAIVCNTSEGIYGNLPKWVGYQAAKSGVIGLVHHIAGRWGREGIRCNAVSPGGILTESHIRATTPELNEWLLSETPSPRLGTSEDIAGTVAFLLSDDAAWVNGHVISLNGGRTPRGG